MSTTQGIDYGMGLSNVDKSTGIRFGVISQHSLMSEALADFESDYGPATCPQCGHLAIDNTVECEECAEMEYTPKKDYHCHVCGPTNCFWSDNAFGEEPIGHHYNKEGYKAHFGNDGFGVWVELSPFYTYARFCSPCAPGAGDLDSPIIDIACVVCGELGSSVPSMRAEAHKYGPTGHPFTMPDRIYCFGHDWFEGGVAPYRVFDVVTGEEVMAVESGKESE